RQRLKKITPECVRYARSNTFEYLDFQYLHNLSKNEKIILLAICRALQDNNSSSVKIDEFKKKYELVCEEFGLDPLKKSQFYNILGRLGYFDFITLTRPRSRKKGETSVIRIDKIPIDILYTELLKQIQ
ncbi:MAG: hypothetical protein ACTSRA_07780, partial [Promethearchaeota archaeon]